MKFYQSIRFRIVAGILLFGSLLIILNAGITFFVLGHNISRMIQNLMETEIDTFLYKYEKDRATSLPHSKYINMYKGLEMVPEKYRDLVKDLAPGVHAIPPTTSRKHPVHAGVIQLPDTPVPYYIFFHGRQFFEENSSLHPKEILIISLALLLIPGIIIGYITSRMLYAPVVKLMGQIKGLNPDKLPYRFYDKHATNEIGMLTRTIEETMNRINAFIQREKQFTRDASHELRTPLTVVKGAVEIMELQPEVKDNPLLKKPIQRIARSVQNMEATIETFLWLAREESEPEESCPVEPVIQKVVNDYQNLIENKDITLEINMLYNKSLNVREEVLYITITNLVRNAIQFTTRGTITITLQESFIEIRDTGEGIENNQLDSVTQTHIKGKDSQGFGLGLSIVSRLCKRFGWKLDIDSQPGKGTQVRILWQNI